MIGSTWVSARPTQRRALNACKERFNMDQSIPRPLNGQTESEANGLTNGHIDNGKPGQLVFRLTTIGLAPEWRRFGLRAICHFTELHKSPYFDDRRTVIVAYQGEASATAAHAAAEQALNEFHAERAGVLDLVDVFGFSGAPDSFIDWFDDATGMGRFEDSLDFVRTAEARTEWKAKHAAPIEPDANGQLDYTYFSDDELGIISARAVKEAPIDWLWKYRFACGEMALLAGDGGLGKSSLLLSIASLITTGGQWPDGAGQAPLGSVIIVSAEDSRETTLKPRLIALGADLDKVVFVTAKMTIQRQDQPPMVNPVSLQDRRYWQEILKRVPGCKMLIIDPIPSYLGRGVNDAKNAELRAVIEPFIDEVTRPAGVCFVANTHLNKNGDSKTPLHRITGSMAYGALPRNVHIVLRDRENPERRLFVQGKCNIAPDGLPAVAYSLVKTTVPSPAGDIETAYPVFEAETVKVDLHEAMGGGKRGPEPVKTIEIARFLVEFMKDKGPVFFGEIMEVAGSRKLIGEPCVSEGYPSWTYRSGLYRAIREVPELPAPDDGWIVVTSRDEPSLRSMKGKARWELRRADGSAF
jgi:putative DNA primase/helicase